MLCRGAVAADGSLIGADFQLLPHRSVSLNSRKILAGPDYSGRPVSSIGCSNDRSAHLGVAEDFEALGLGALVMAIPIAFLKFAAKPYFDQHRYM